VIAVVPVRGGVLATGADETIAECGGNVLLVGTGCRLAAAEFVAATTRVRVAELGDFAPIAWAEALAAALADEDAVVLPANADGRDLAPHLAHVLGRPLWAGATQVDPTSVVASRHDDRVLVTATVAEPFVATLIPGARAVAPAEGPPSTIEELAVALQERPAARKLQTIPPTGASVDLADAERIVAGGAGLGTAEAFALLRPLGDALDAAVGATRVVVDRGWTSHPHQIGTTGVAVAPELYVAFGISGAVQHLTGVEPAQHTIAVNLDPSCPMMRAADLAVVADAPAVLEALIQELSEELYG